MDLKIFLDRKTDRRTNRRTAGAVLTIAALTTWGSMAGHALADELFVPSAEYPTIQAALDATTDGDVVVLAAGTYSGAGNEALTAPRVAFTLRGETGDPADVVIEGPGDPYVRVVHAITFNSGPTGSIVRVEDLTVRGFTGRDGAAVRVNGATMELDNCVFTGNSVGTMECFESGYGGAFYVTSGNLAFVDCVIASNSAYDVVCSGHGATGAGGGIYSRGGGTLVFERCLIENNRAGGYGGGSGAGISADFATVTFIDTMVRNNRLNGIGGGGGVRAGSVISINSDFVDNAAFGTESTGRAGAISATNLTMVGGTVTGNRAGDVSYGSYGGAISATTVDITNVVFANNRVAAYPGETLQGAALYVGDGGTLTNVTFAGNTGANDGEAVYAVDGALELRNCIVDNGDWLGSDTAAVTATWSCIVGGFPGEGNIDADPMLDAQYRPMPGSPVIDAGNTTLLPADIYDLDGDGDTSEPLPFDAAGLARAVNDPATPDTGVGSPVVDMGAYEVQSACRADLDGDGVLTLFDFLEFQNAFDAGDPIADFDGDGELTLFDFLAFQNEFDAGCG